MLVVSRKLDESIIIEPENGGEPIEVKIISIDNQVKVGVEAAKGCKIWRKELYKTVEANRRAAQSAPIGALRGLNLHIPGEGEKGSGDNG